MKADVGTIIDPALLRERLPVDRRRMAECGPLEDDYLSKQGRPVILTDAMADWPALRKWTFEFFAARAGDQQVEVAEQFFGPARRFNMPFGPFLEYCEDRSILAHAIEDSARLYCAYQPFSHESDLLDDFQWPPILRNLYATLEGAAYDWYLRSFGVLLIGPAGTITPLHVDMFGTHAWLAQLRGRKHLLFFTPDEVPRMLARAGHSARLAPDGRPVRGTVSLESLIDFRDARAYEAVLEPGEMIVFPQGWYHYVTSLEPSISLSFNFVNETNFAAHMLETMRDLPRWTRRLNGHPQLREQMGITWTAQDFTLV
jgi:hypothetical protein